MLLQELKEQIAQIPVTSKREALERIVLYVSIADRVYPQYEEYLSEAGDYQEFFDAVYADDDQKFTSVWAEWAKLTHKKWLDRFESTLQIESIRLKGDGLPVEFGTGIVLAPTGSRDNIANLYLFESGAFNVETADFVTSLGGTFTCAGYDFCGVYGLYNSHGNVILEEWQAEKAPVPTKDSLKKLV